MPTLFPRANRKKTSFNNHKFGYKTLGKSKEIELYLNAVSEFDIIRDTWKPKDSIETNYKSRQAS
jgi:hypothetical protein